MYEVFLLVLYAVFLLVPYEVLLVWPVLTIIVVILEVFVLIIRWPISGSINTSVLLENAVANDVLVFQAVLVFLVVLYEVLLLVPYAVFLDVLLVNPQPYEVFVLTQVFVATMAQVFVFLHV